jgi:hypothetical protein
MGDFDFLNGSWNIANRRLTKLLAGSDDWDEFPATSCCIPFFGGAANSEEYVCAARGFRGLSIRSFDPAREEWTIWWINSRDGRLQPPVHGRFDADGLGTFYGDDTHEGTPVRVRYLWSRITPVSARWEQAFSVDGEQTVDAERTWETNWIMDFTRRAD